jgi:hypothetical protein
MRLNEDILVSSLTPSPAIDMESEDMPEEADMIPLPLPLGTATGVFVWKVTMVVSHESRVLTSSINGACLECCQCATPTCIIKSRWGISRWLLREGTAVSLFLAHFALSHARHVARFPIHPPT